MNVKQSTSSDIQDSFPVGTSASADYIWKNVITERRLSVSWLGRLYQGSIFDDVWTILSSKIS